MHDTRLSWIAGALAAAATLAPAAGFGPWDAAAAREEAGRAPAIREAGNTGGMGAAAGFLLLRAYQQYLSRLNTRGCPMYPSCSAYTVEAVHRFGPLVGILLAADRLFHEGSEQRTAPLIRRHGRLLHLDPLSENTFWWMP